MAERFRVEDATIGVITALQKEYIAVLRAFDCISPEILVPGRGAGRRYSVVGIPAINGGVHIVAIAQLLDMGNNAAGIRATTMLQRCPKIRHIIMTGIAGAVPHPQRPEDHVRLGDIVISSAHGVVQYDYKKETIQRKLSKSRIYRWLDFLSRNLLINLGSACSPTDLYSDIEEHYTSHFENRHRPRPPSAELIEAVNSLEIMRVNQCYPWESRIQTICNLLGPEWQRPSEQRDRLQDWNEGWPPTPHPEDRRRRAGVPRVFSGAIASGNVLLKNPLVRDALRDKYKAKAVEMEASGIADAAWTHEIGYLIVRGTCDYCNPDKGDDWQEYAAVIAACCTRSIIEATDAGGDAAASGAIPPLNSPIAFSNEEIKLMTELENARTRRMQMEVAQNLIRTSQGHAASGDIIIHEYDAPKRIEPTINDVLPGAPTYSQPSTNISILPEMARSSEEADENGASVSKHFTDLRETIKSLESSLEHRQLHSLIDNEVIPWLEKVDQRLAREERAEMYFLVADVKTHQALATEDASVKKQLIAEASFYQLKAKHELGK